MANKTTRTPSLDSASGGGSSVSWRICREDGDIVCRINEDECIAGLVANRSANKLSAAGNPSVYTFVKFGDIKIAVTATDVG